MKEMTVDVLAQALEAALRRALPTAPAAPAQYMTIKECAQHCNMSEGWFRDQLRERDWEVTKYEHNPAKRAAHRAILDRRRLLRRAVHKPSGNRLVIHRERFEEWFRTYCEETE